MIWLEALKFPDDLVVFLALTILPPDWRSTSDGRTTKRESSQIGSSNGLGRQWHWQWGIRCFLCTSQCYLIFELRKDWLEMATETISIFSRPTWSWITSMYINLFVITCWNSPNHERNKQVISSSHGSHHFLIWPRIASPNRRRSSPFSASFGHERCHRMAGGRFESEVSVLSKQPVVFCTSEFLELLG